ncbi:MAG: 50S ribosomal protein L29 [Candidatus Dependentiae bacterium]|jgi:ribosomal protein L29
MTAVDMTALAKEVAGKRKELFNLKLTAGSGQVKDSSQFKKLRKDVARLLTQMNSTQAHTSVENGTNSGE